MKAIDLEKNARSMEFALGSVIWDLRHTGKIADRRMASVLEGIRFLLLAEDDADMSLPQRDQLMLSRMDTLLANAKTAK